MQGSCNSRSDEIRKRLIEAAGEVFAEMGYEAATVREITVRANLNVAAVNYYFRDKLQLYRSVLQTVTGRTLHLLQEHCLSGSPEARLRNFVQCILTATSKEEDDWPRVLMARTIMEPHEVQTTLIVEAVRPMHEIAEDIIRDLMGSHSGPALAALAASFVVSLCVNRVPQQRVDQLLSPETGAGDIERSAELMYQFVLAGIMNL